MLQFARCPYGTVLAVADLRACLKKTFHIKPAWDYVVAYLMGNYYDSKDTHKTLFDWIGQNHFSTGPYSYKEAVIDELDTASAKEYVTKISVQVFRAKTVSGH